MAVAVTVDIPDRTEQRIFPGTPDGQSLAEPLLVSIDLSEIAFTEHSDARKEKS